MSKQRKYESETLQLHIGQESPDSATDSRAVPIYQTISYVLRDSQHAADHLGLRDADNIYGRLTDTTQDVFEKRTVALEGGSAALTVASGVAAVTYTAQALTQAGDHIVVRKTIYDGTYNLLAYMLKQYDVETTFVDAHKLDEAENAICPNTEAAYPETLGNPNSDTPGADAIAATAHRHGLPVIVDNTFGTPYLVRPFERGADIVIHFITKFIGGCGTTLGGITVDGSSYNQKKSGKSPSIADPSPSYHGVSFVDVVGPAAFVTYTRAILLRDEDGAIPLFNAFLFLQGIETLSLRMECHVEDALKVAELLLRYPQVEGMNHPSLTDYPDHTLYQEYFPSDGASIFTFSIKSGQKEVSAFINNLKIFSLLVNTADMKSLVIHPATMTHSQLSNVELVEQGIQQNAIRLPIGAGNINDILADLEGGLAVTK